MKHFQIVLMVVFIASLFTACGGGSKRVSLPEGVSRDISVLSLGADTSSLSPDQIALLNQTLNWMDRDILQVLKRNGFQPTRINAENEFTGSANGYLLKTSITHHKMIPKSARFWGGMMAGADLLSAHFDLVDSNKETILSWDDTQGSTKGGTYCAQTSNPNATNKIVDHLAKP